MLTTNLRVSGGLVNGSLDTANAIVYQENTQPPTMPLYVLVEFRKKNFQ